MPDSYAILIFTALNLPSITSHIHNWGLFLLWLHPFILSGVISPLISSSILGTYWPGEFIFQWPIFLPLHTVHGVSRQANLSGLPFPSPVDHILSDLSTMTHPTWVAPQAWLSFIELDKAVVRVIRLASFLWLWFQSVCPLMPSCSAYHFTWVSLTLDVGYLFMATAARCSCHSLPWMWGNSSRSCLCAITATVLVPCHMEVSPHSHSSAPIPKKGNAKECSNC